MKIRQGNRIANNYDLTDLIFNKEVTTSPKLIFLKSLIRDLSICQSVRPSFNFSTKTQMKSDHLA